MKVIFEKKELEYIFENGKEKGKPSYPPEVIKGFIRKVNIILDVENTQELRMFKSLRLEELSGNYVGFHSIRVNNRYRIVLKILKEQLDKYTVEVVEISDLKDYH